MKQQLQELIDNNQNFTRALKSKKSDPNLLQYVESFQGNTLMEKIYNCLNNCETPKCLDCGKDVPLISLTNGYRNYCNKICNDNYNKKHREEHAINKLNNFGNLKYISSYNGSHSLVIVQNTKCNHIFEACYGNLFSNENYCSICGKQDKINQLINYNKNDHWSEERKDKIRQETIERKQAYLDKIKLQNELIENAAILTNNLTNFIQDYINVSRGWTESKLKHNFPKIYQIVENQKGDTFWEKIFNLFNPEHKNECLHCGKPTNFVTYNGKNKIGYRTFCSISCSSAAEATQIKIQKTNQEKYGTKHHLSSENIKQKRYKTNIIKYGFPIVIQNKEIFDKIMKSQFRLKSYILPSGKNIKLMGYEPQVVDYLLNNNIYTEESISFDCPTFKYNDNHYYYPDLYIPNENLIIEVKSEWTYNRDLEKNLAKKEAVLNQGFNFNFYIWDDNKKQLTII
jgi:hypothetical protein